MEIITSEKLPGFEIMEFRVMSFDDEIRLRRQGDFQRIEIRHFDFLEINRKSIEISRVAL